MDTHNTIDYLQYIVFRKIIDGKTQPVNLHDIICDGVITIWKKNGDLVKMRKGRDFDIINFDKAFLGYNGTYEITKCIKDKQCLS